jgi:hypothetical protein
MSGRKNFYSIDGTVLLKTVNYVCCFVWICSYFLYCRNILTMSKLCGMIRVLRNATEDLMSSSLLIVQSSEYFSFIVCILVHHTISHCNLFITFKCDIIVIYIFLNLTCFCPFGHDQRFLLLFMLCIWFQAYNYCMLIQLIIIYIHSYKV